jgi:NAD-dependent deacetylase
MSSDFNRKIKQAADLIRKSNYIVAFTGAGISTPSGIPDFRSQGTGLWQKDDPMEVASLSSFLYSPMSFFNWFHPLYSKIYFSSFNAAHKALTILEDAKKIKTIITQNIDNLHQQSGSLKVIEIHGSTSELICLDCHKRIHLNHDLAMKFINDFDIPRCSRCKSYLKPTVTLFEEQLPYHAWEKANKSLLKADLVIVVGSSLDVYPANQLPLLAVENGSKLIINTISTTPLDNRADLLLPFDVVDVWEQLIKELDLNY